MAKHRMPKKHRARKAVLAGTAAAGLSGALVLGHATNTTADNVMVQLANTVIGAGGQGDPTSFRVPAKLSNTVVPTGYDYAPVNYPATISLASSRDVGVTVMKGILDDHSGEDYVIITGYSEGTLVAEKVRGSLQGIDPEEDAPSKDKLAFLFIASPFAPNGGIYNRFPGASIPGVIDSFAPATPTRYDTTYIANEYDPYADFPAYFNPLALANTALGVRYAHPDEYYNAIQPGVTPAYVTSDVNTAGGTDTYVLVYNQHLPLLGPLRELSKLTLTSPLTDPVLAAVEPLLRVLIDASYTDRVNAHPATPTPFSFITPPEKIIEALGAVPGALGQGATGLLSGGQAATVPPPSPNLTTVPVQNAPAPVSTPMMRQSRAALVADQSSEPTDASPTPTAPTPAGSAPAASASTGTDGSHPAASGTGDTPVTTGGTTPASGAPTGDTPSTTTPKTTTPGTTTGTTTNPTTPSTGTTSPSEKTTTPDKTPSGPAASSSPGGNSPGGNTAGSSSAGGNAAA